MIVGAGLLLVGWPTLDLVPAPGVDPSWHGGLHMAVRDGLDFGRDVVYTYGPLGFLKLPEYWGTNFGAVAIAYGSLTRLLYLIVAFALARRSFGTVGAVLILVVLAPLSADVALPLAVAGAFWLLGGDGSTRAARVVAAGLGTLAGVEGLAKLNTGIAIVAILLVALALCGRPQRRWLIASLVGSAGLVALVGWLATGQPLATLPAFVANSLHVTSGYSSAMLLEQGGLEWQYSAAAVVAAAGAVGLWRTSAGRGRRLALGLVGVWLLLAWLAFKQGFIRHAGEHPAMYFQVLLSALVVAPWARRDRAAALAVMGLAFVALLAAGNHKLSALVSPVDRVDAAVDQLGTLVAPSKRAELFEEGRARIGAAGGLDEGTLAQLKGHSVHVARTEAAVVWANGLWWSPLPVFQDYVAYTPALDALNAERLRGPKAPDRILLGGEQSIDGRVPAWDAPEATLSMLCHYRPLVTQGTRWVVLSRTANRCGAPRRIATVRTGWGDPVAPPAPRAGFAVFMRVSGAGVRGLERLRNLAFRAYPRTVVLDGVGHPFVAAVAGDGLLLSAPDVDLPEGFGQAPEPQSITLERERAPSRPDALRFDFYAMPVRR